MATSAQNLFLDFDWLEGYAEFDPYPTLREALAPEYADLPAEDIEALVESIYPEASAEGLESFFKSLKKAVRSVGRVAKRALPGVIQGATTGAAAGPWGALVGGIAGGALRAATAGRGRAARGVARTAQAGAGLARRVLGRGTLQQLAGSPAAAQLLKTLGRPQVTQALMSMAMGGAGKRAVRVGNVPVPTGAITNALRRLLERAETELHEQTAGETSGTPLYLLDAAGEFVVDPTDEDERADLVLDLLELAEVGDDLEWDDEVDDEFEEEDEDWSEDEDGEFDDGESPEDEAVLLYEGVDFAALEFDSPDEFDGEPL